MKEEAAIQALQGEPKLEKGSLSGPPLKKIVVAIHGIGSQRRSDTVRSVARRFGSRAEPPVPILPLGYFHIEKTGIVRVSRLDLPQSDPLACIGFAEVFWADIPRNVEKEDDTLEETKGWGATVISRAQAAYHRNVPNGILKPQDFQLAAGALDEVIETVDVIENLCTVAARAGVFKFDLAQLLRDYLGDVQIVAEFRYFRQKIVYRFHDAMEQIVKWFATEYPGGTPELYVVAHSEGTVVSFLGLLEALAGRRVTDPDHEKHPQFVPWIQHVHGFMTIGSPIDKHLTLWPRMWEHLERPPLRGNAQENWPVILLERPVNRAWCGPGRSAGATITTSAIPWASSSTLLPYGCRSMAARPLSSLRKRTTLVSAVISFPAKRITITGMTRRFSGISSKTWYCARTRRLRLRPGRKIGPASDLSAPRFLIWQAFAATPPRCLSCSRRCKRSLRTMRLLLPQDWRLACSHCC